MKKSLKFLGRLILIVVCVLAFRFYISPVVPFVVKGESMYPNVSEGYHIVERINYIFNDSDPRRGDIIVFDPLYKSFIKHINHARALTIMMYYAII